MWKQIKEFENYSVSSDGQVRNDKTGYILSQNDNGSGYKCVNIKIKQKQNGRLVHRLVAEAFIENPENKETIDHIDRNKYNNTVDNLRWATRYEQAQNTEWIDKAKNISETKSGYQVQLMRNGINNRKHFKTIELAEAYLETLISANNIRCQ